MIDESKEFLIKNDIEAILFDEGRFDMQYYERMQPMIEELVTLVKIHAGSALDDYKHEVRRMLLDRTNEAVKGALYGS